MAHITDNYDYKYKVSVVTAVYNVREYIDEMVESIISQTIGLDNIQLILVDDGSDDETGRVCDEYKNKFPNNIIVVHKEHKGVSSARNVGLKLVEGKYVNFCDADDKLEDTALEKMFEFMEENYEYIDFVSIGMSFFDAKTGNHPLNYKYAKTKIVDLRTDYNAVQLSMCDILIKSEVLEGLEFDENLHYAEDGKLINCIILEKMQYGVLSDAIYFYRKRENVGSAIDRGRFSKEYYLPYMKRFVTYLFDYAYGKKGYIPKYIQCACLYELNWRIKNYPCVQPGILTDEEEKEYFELLEKALCNIEDAVVINSGFISPNLKMAILRFIHKAHRNNEKAHTENCIKDVFMDYESPNIGSYSVVYEFLELEKNKFIIEGYLRSPMSQSEFDVFFSCSDDELEYRAELSPREDNCDYMLDEIIVHAYNFEICMPIYFEKHEYCINAFISINGHSIKCNNVLFGQFFPLTKKIHNSYYVDNSTVFRWEDNKIIVNPNSSRLNIFYYEVRVLYELLSSKDIMVKRGACARIMYWAAKHFVKKNIWIVSDRLDRADDNGEAIFKYLIKNKIKNTEVYFQISKKSTDYIRMKKIGKTIDFDSNFCKILSLLCDAYISSQGDEWVYNRFFSYKYIYCDILHEKKFIFLQHGIIKDDLSRWLNRRKKNIDIFITSTSMEYQSILKSRYEYSKEQVKLTGLPRYDYLYDASIEKKIITVMPTWRAYLVGTYKPREMTRGINSGFENDEYCKMFKELFSDRELLQNLGHMGYSLQFLLHPSMPRDCVEYFKCDPLVKILDSETSYRKIYAESRLVITDYSSAVFDFAYLYKPVLYYQQDREEFFSGKHSYDKGYFDYEKDGFGEVAINYEQLKKYIIEYVNNGCQLKDIYKKRIDDTFNYHDRCNCHRVINELIKLEGLQMERG